MKNSFLLSIADEYKDLRLHNNLSIYLCLILYGVFSRGGMLLVVYICKNVYIHININKSDTNVFISRMHFHRSPARVKKDK